MPLNSSPDVLTVLQAHRLMIQNIEAKGLLILYNFLFTLNLVHTCWSHFYFTNSNFITTSLLHSMIQQIISVFTDHYLWRTNEKQQSLTRIMQKIVTLWSNKNIKDHWKEVKRNQTFYIGLRKNCSNVFKEDIRFKKCNWHYYSINNSHNQQLSFHPTRQEVEFEEVNAVII